MSPKTALVLARCDYCGAHVYNQAHLDDWRRIDEPDGPPRGLPAQWWCCVKCAAGDVPHEMRVRRRFDYVVIDLFTWGGLPATAARERVRAIVSAGPLLDLSPNQASDDLYWLLDDLVRRSVLEREEWRPWWRSPMTIYRDPAPIWRRIISRVRRWWRARK